jgi:hypothetical protein
MRAEPLDAARAPPVFQDEVRALDIPQLAEPVDESLAAG